MLASILPVRGNEELVEPDACETLVCPVFGEVDTTVGSVLVCAEVTTLEPVNEVDEACVSVAPELTTVDPALIGRVDSKVTVATDWLV